VAYIVIEGKVDAQSVSSSIISIEEIKNALKEEGDA
jgi:hypothetical protein